MNKKEYIKPNSKHIVIAGATLLAGSNGDQGLQENPVPDFDGNAEGKFSLWEDED